MALEVDAALRRRAAWLRPPHFLTESRAICLEAMEATLDTVVAPWPDGIAFAHAADVGDPILFPPDKLEEPEQELRRWRRWGNHENRAAVRAMATCFWDEAPYVYLDVHSPASTLLRLMRLRAATKEPRAGELLVDASIQLLDGLRWLAIDTSIVCESPSWLVLFAPRETARLGKVLEVVRSRGGRCWRAEFAPNEVLAWSEL